MNKKIIAVIIAAVVAIPAVAVLSLSSRFVVRLDNENPAENEQKVEEVQQSEGSGTLENNTEKSPDKTDVSGTGEEKKTYTPTFVYFTSNEHLKETEEVLKKLQKEYKDKVKFDIRNVDETGEDMSQSFGDGSLPVLLMHDSNNDICSILMQTADYDSLKGAIETALAN